MIKLVASDLDGTIIDKHNDIYQDNLSLSEIAEKCGYLDYVYFSKKFKSVMGLSPREYRYQ